MSNKCKRPMIVLGQANGMMFVIRNHGDVCIEFRDYDTVVEESELGSCPDRFGRDSCGHIYEKLWVH